MCNGSWQAEFTTPPHLMWLRNVSLYNYNLLLLAVGHTFICKAWAIRFPLTLIWGHLFPLDLCNLARVLRAAVFKQNVAQVYETSL